VFLLAKKLVVAHRRASEEEFCKALKEVVPLRDKPARERTQEEQQRLTELRAILRSRVVSDFS
jgi:hypothetical protein